jgi:small-conductance mechanosensitive channel/CRP-like cAMP-binding protein
MDNLASGISLVSTRSMLIAGIAVALGFLGARYWKTRHALAYFLIQLVLFATLTGLLLDNGIVPYRAGIAAAAAPQRFLIGLLEIMWWLAAAALAVGFLRAFVVLGGKPSESKLLQDLLAALIYLTATFVIIANIFEFPVKGLLATSGAVAIIIGLALQSSLGDVFSGIVLNLGRPYRVGDWIIVDDTAQGTVIETNWRATHLLTVNQDVAIVPNSIVAKAKITNCSAPSKTHGAAVRIQLDASVAPAVGADLLKEVLLGSTHILRSPAPAVVIQSLTADMIEFELSYAVTDISAVDMARNEVFDRVHRATRAAGVKFAPRLGAVMSVTPINTEESATAARLLSSISLFATLTEEEKTSLALQMQRREYKPDEVIVKSGTVVEALSIVSYGVLVASEEQDGRKFERLRITPGIYFGEAGLLTGRPLSGEISALTKVVIYDISKDALCPLLQARPSMAEELSELLANRQLARRTVLDHLRDEDVHPDGLAVRLAATIKRVFALA